MAQAVAHVRERERASRWVNRQVQDMLDVPGIVYKYVPFRLLEFGCPLTLRATPPVALNDVMEGNLSTFKADADMDRDRWYEFLGERLREIFGEDSLSPEELEGRKRRYGDPRVSTIVREHLSRFVGVVSFSANPLIPTMWAHYAENSGFVVGYRTDAIRPLGMGLRRVLYMELAPVYWPERDDTVELNLRRPQFSWTRIRGESDVEGGGRHGSVEEGAGSCVGADGGSPEGDWSRRRRRGGWGGSLGARAAVEREPETGRGSAAAARRVAGHGLA